MTSLRAMTNNPTESQLQGQIVQGLRALGYIVIVTGRPPQRVECPKCFHWFTPKKSSTRNTKGASDLYVGREEWGPWQLSMELKTPEVHTLLGRIPPGRLRKEQKEFVTAGVTVVIYSLEDALEAIKKFTTFLGQ